jgi:vancomycin resistance protein YoaR
VVFGINNSKQTGRSGKKAPAHARPKKRVGLKVALSVVIALVVLAAAAFGVEIFLSFDKIHPGVSVAGVDLGGLTKQQAQAKLNDTLGSTLGSTVINAVPDAQTQQRLDATTLAATKAGDGGESDEAAITEGAAVATVASTWNITHDEVGATIDDLALVDAAYAVGRGGLLQFFQQRYDAWVKGVDLEPIMTYDEDKLTALASTIGKTIGMQMVNYGVAIDQDGVANVTDGSDGQCVDTRELQELFTQAFLAGGQRDVIIPLTVDPVDISQQQAQEAANTLTEELAQPVTISYQDDSWQVDPAQLGSWVKSVTVPVEYLTSSTSELRNVSLKDAAVTNPTAGVVDNLSLQFIVDEDIAVPAIQAIMGDQGYGSAKDAWFDVSSGLPVIQDGESGEGPNIRESIPKLGEIIFNGAERSLTFTQGIVEPKITRAAAEAMGVKELIASYKLGYGYGGSSNREFNIERALSFLDNSLIAPGGYWDFHEIVGNASYDNGFKGAGAIMGNKVITEEGGGICNVATGVYNAAYDAGLKIIERTNHSLYMSNYPAGRDAAVSWPSPDMIFENDTQNYILVTASWDGYNMVVSIWGTSEGRTVESSNSAWSYWDTGSSITNYRTVYDKNGNVLHEDTFRSTFRKPEPEKKPEDETPATPETPEATSDTNPTDPADPGTTDPDATNPTDPADPANTTTTG